MNDAVVDEDLGLVPLPPPLAAPPSIEVAGILLLLLIKWLLEFSPSTSLPLPPPRFNASIFSRGEKWPVTYTSTSSADVVVVGRGACVIGAVVSEGIRTVAGMGTSAKRFAGC